MVIRGPLYSHEKMTLSMLFTLKTSYHTEGKRKESNSVVTPRFLSFVFFFVFLFLFLFCFLGFFFSEDKSVISKCREQEP